MGVVAGWTLVLLLGALDGGAAPERLRVAVAGSAPFVMPEEGNALGGVSVEVWRSAAGSLGVDYELVPVPGVAQALDAVQRGDADVAVGPISITAERAEHVAFTQPYYRSSLTILAPAVEDNLYTRLLPFLSRAFFAALFFLALILGVVGTLVWLAERRENPGQFPDDPLRGIGNGIWLALVTMTTVGYGDRAPVTLRGRVVVGIWMLVSMVTASSLTAGLATAFTLSQLPQAGITSAEQLPGRKVAVVQGTTGARFASQRGAQLVTTESLAAALDVLKRGRADALVFDRPQLGHALRMHPDERLRLSEANYEPQGYGFAVGLDSPLRERLDVALLRMRESGRMGQIIHQWLDDG